MNRHKITQLAEARGQVPVLVEVRNRPAWLTVNGMPCEIGRLAECLKSDDYCLWECGQLLAFDRDGNWLSPRDCVDLVAMEPIRFFRRPRTAKAMCGRCGLAAHIWKFGWKHSSGGRVKRVCCDSIRVFQLR